MYILVLVRDVYLQVLLQSNVKSSTTLAATHIFKTDVSYIFVTNVHFLLSSIFSFSAIKTV